MNNEIKSLGKSLSSIDWNFPNNNGKTSVHSLHPYPAKFIPEIPSTLIKCLDIQKGMTVFDPFCGSGTTLVEANLAGYHSVGVDLNPIACMISKSKMTKLPIEFINSTKDCIARARDNSKEKIPEIPHLSHWFKKETQQEITALLSEINKGDNSAVQLFQKTALSSILVRISNQDSDTRYAAVKKKVTKKDTFSSFFSACEKIEKIKSMQEISSSPYKIINKDILKINPKEVGFRVGAIITSPPYPNAYEYWLYHKYRMWWLGFDPLSVKEQEIGARPHYHKKNPQDEQYFENQMDKVFSLFDEVLVKNGKVCFVIGRSIIRGRTVDNAAIIEKVGLNHGLKQVARIPRTILSSRKSFNLSHANIKKEEIVIMKRV